MNPVVDFGLMWPELIIVAALVATFVSDLFDSESRKRTQWVALVGVLAAFAAIIWFALDGRSGDTVGESFYLDDFALLVKAIVVPSAALVLLLGLPQLWKGEYCLMLLSSLLGVMVLASARDLVLFVVAFELLALPGYMLVAWNKRSQHGYEGTFKYYLLGVVATAVMLYGVSFLFGIASGTSFEAVRLALAGGAENVVLAKLAAFFVIAGLLFKISAVPFHFWAPDAYQSAPIPVATFLSVVAKVAGVVALLQMTMLVFPTVDDVWQPVLWVIAAATMTIGNVVALRQTDLVRLLAYSSIAQAGYMLVPLAVNDDFQQVRESVFIYMMIYAAMNIGAFATVHAIAHRSSTTAISSLKGLFTKAPALSVLLSLFLLSLAGMPPFGGWFAKLAVFQAAIDANTVPATLLVVIAGMNTAIGLVYYAGTLRTLWQPADDATLTETESKLGPSLVMVLAVSAVAVLVSGVLPGLVADLGALSSFGQ